MPSCPQDAREQAILTGSIPKFANLQNSSPSSDSEHRRKDDKCDCGAFGHVKYLHFYPPIYRTETLRLPESQPHCMISGVFPSFCG